MDPLWQEMTMRGPFVNWRERHGHAGGAEAELPAAASQSTLNPCWQEQGDRASPSPCGLCWLDSTFWSGLGCCAPLLVQVRSMQSHAAAWEPKGRGQSLVAPSTGFAALPPHRLPVSSPLLLSFIPGEA